MPLEGHWGRINTPIRTEGKRNVRIVGVLLAVVVAGVIASVVVGLTQSSPRVVAPKGCISVLIAGVMGSERFHPCGHEAAVACRSAVVKHDPASATITAACRKQGLL